MKFLPGSPPPILPEDGVADCAIPGVPLSRVRGRDRYFRPLALLSASADGDEAAAREIGVRTLPDPPFNVDSAGNGVDYQN